MYERKDLLYKKKATEDLFFFISYPFKKLKIKTLFFFCKLFIVFTPNELKCSALTSLNVLMMRISKWNFKKGVKIIIHDLYPYKRFKKITSHFKLKLRKTVKKKKGGGG